MPSERERWNTLEKLDLGYSLDVDASKQEMIIEDVILDNDEFFKASKGLFNRNEYMLAKAALEMSYAISDEPPKELIQKLLLAKDNVIHYLNEKT